MGLLTDLLGDGNATSGVAVEDEGGLTVAAASVINFVGAGVAVADAGSGRATVTIPGQGAMTRLGQSVISGSVAATIDFTGIPTTYESLLLEVMGRGDSAAAAVDLLLQFNGDTGPNYDEMTHYAVGGSTPDDFAVAGTTRISPGGIAGAGATAGKPGSCRVTIPNYARTTFQKIIYGQCVRFTSQVVGGFVTQQSMGLWRSTAAVNRLTLSLSAGNFAIGSIATLYGVS